MKLTVCVETLEKLVALHKKDGKACAYLSLEESGRIVEVIVEHHSKHVPEHKSIIVGAN